MAECEKTTFTRRLEGQIEQQKNTNRESDGAIHFDGFQWMGGHNNQPKVGLHNGI
jgi:hypothetical protein